MSSAVSTMQLSEHFQLSELTFSSTAARLGYFNIPSEENIHNLQILCGELLEPGRSLLNVPLHVDSGYRSPLVNHAVGGALDSAHIDGRAADIIPVGFPLTDAFDMLRLSNLPFDQLILECGAWCHLAIAPAGVAPRREVLKASGGPGNWRYDLVT